jgi:CubicO group peptidase (beta-lactamase class C family)
LPDQVDQPQIFTAYVECGEMTGKIINLKSNFQQLFHRDTKIKIMNKRLPFLLFFFSVLLAFTIHKPVPDTKSTAPIITAEAKNRIDHMLKSFIDSSKAMGLSALIFEKGKEVYFNAYGYADKEANRPMDRNTIVRIFSMTKPIIGVALMSLYEKGKFQLDDPLYKYAPEFRDMNVFVGADADGKPILVPAKRPITIRDITRHTAGFAGGGDAVLAAMVRKADVMNRNNTLSEMAKRLASLPLAFHPGDQWAYGPSVDVQAYLVEKLSGKPLEQYLKETIFDPLKMTHTGYYVPESERKHFAAVYNRSNEGVLTRMPDSSANSMNTQHWTLKQGGLGLTSTIDDYMKFAQMLVHKGELNGVRVLKPETVKLMATNHLSDTISKRMWLPDRGQVGFGIDFAVRLAPPKTREENNGIVGEFFWDGAMSTLFWVDPVNDLTAVLFTQLLPYDKVKLHNSFRDAVYGEYDPAKN